MCAVSFLNTTPLVWGLLHGPQRGELDLRFEIPAVCADVLRAGEADIGIVPAIELDRQALEIVPDLGIASRGKVRSILLVSKVAPERICTLAADASSRTSVVLAQILLREKFGAYPNITPHPPRLDEMLAAADAALVIGDPALTLPPRPAEFLYDLGEVWTEWTGLPMVFAVWAARSGFDWREAARHLRGSYEYGRDRLRQLAGREGPARGIPEQVAYAYLTENIHFELGADYQAGLAHFREAARRHGLV